MAVGEFASTIAGGVTPVCSECGVHLCWDISEQDYEEDKPFWDDWICKECNHGHAMSLTQWKSEKSSERWRRKLASRAQGGAPPEKKLW